MRQRQPALFAIVGKIFRELQPVSLLACRNFRTTHRWCMELLLVFSSNVLKRLSIKEKLDIEISTTAWLIFEYVGLSSIYFLCARIPQCRVMAWKIEQGPGRRKSAADKAFLEDNVVSQKESAQAGSRAGSQLSKCEFISIKGHFLITVILGPKDESNQSHWTLRRHDSST